MKCSFCAMPEEKQRQTKTMKYVAIDTRLDNIHSGAEFEPKAQAQAEAEAPLGAHLTGPWLMHWQRA